jgi:hypothetical protein
MLATTTLLALYESQLSRIQCIRRDITARNAWHDAPDDAGSLLAAEPQLVFPVLVEELAEEWVEPLVV